jgi:NADPH-dependent 2,4-dienoyl-CoA reductase/sulfur reductase-like enzyme
MTPREIVVVGTGLAGMRVIETLRRDGYEGRLSFVGEERHLPYDRPPLSKQLLSGKWAEEQVFLARNGVGLDDLAIDAHLGQRVRSVDLGGRRVHLAGSALRFDALVLAIGAAPRPLPDGWAAPGRHTLRTLDDARAIRAAFASASRVAIVGAGFIGLEVAATARRLGLEVSLVEAMALPLVQVLGPDLARVCAQLHLDHGVDLHCGVTVSQIEAGGGCERLLLSDGQRLEADVVIFATGVSPSTTWLTGSGLHLDDGILCGPTGATSAAGVWAAGDCARWFHPLFNRPLRLEHWSSAAEQGVAVARSILAAGDSRPLATVPFFWSDQYGTKIQFAGRRERADTVRVMHGSVDEGRFVALYGRAGRLVAALAFNWPSLLVGYRRLLAGAPSWHDALALAAQYEDRYEESAGTA